MRVPKQGTAIVPKSLSHILEKPEEEQMPLLPIILWVGVPVILLGGGYWIIQTVH